MRAKILSASAGSGKTYRLAYKYVHDTIKHFNDKPYLYRAILAVTFTNKATEEMKSRILKEINDIVVNPDGCSYLKDLQRDTKLAREEIITRAKTTLSRILHDYSRFTILTIDKFFQRILRAFIKELGIDINYNIELETSTILSRSTDALIDDITTNTELQQWIMEFAQENIDDNGDWDIRKYILQLGGELFKESNKQAILQALPKERLKEIISQAETRYAQTIATAKRLGGEALEIMHRAGVDTVDFTGKSTSFTNYFRKAADGILAAPTKTIRDKSQTTDKWSALPTAQALAPQLQPILAELCDLYDGSLRLTTTLPKIKRNYRSFALLQDIYQKLSTLCQEEGIMLLSETKYILSRFVADNDAPFIYEKTGNRFERFMIDEFQDTSLKEWSNFVPLLQNAMSQSEDTSVLIVGDVKQSIYRWRGGDWRILQQGVSKVLGEADTKLEIMANNYRSLRNVVKFNNMAIKRVVKYANNEINSNLDKALEAKNITESCYHELHNTLKSAYKGHHQKPKSSSDNNGYIRVERYDEEPPIVECIKSVIERGYSYNDIMILHRKGDDGAKTAKILLDYKQQTNAPFNIMTQDSLVVGNADISNFVIALLRLSQNSNDHISRAIANDFLGRRYDEEPTKEELNELAYISQLTPEQAFERIVINYELDKYRGEMAYLQALHEQIITFCSSKVADIQLFLKEWEESGCNKNLVVEKSDMTIELTSIHKSKGLERKVIIIPYCDWKIGPKTNSTIWATPEVTADNNSEELAEIGQFPVSFDKSLNNSIYSDDYHRETVFAHIDNINLLYVALTRACEALYVYIPNRAQKNIGSVLWEVLTKDNPNNDSTRIEYGVEESPIRSAERGDKGIENMIMEEYPTTDITTSLHLSSERYFDDEEPSQAVSARNMGIAMHAIMCEATNMQSVIERIEEYTAAGKIDSTQAEELKSVMKRELSRADIAEWFSDEWDAIHNEEDIICNAHIGTRRPDRVMIRGDRAVVVDYKFGHDKPKGHAKTMSIYMQQLRDMGYSKVEGYLWYLTLGEIEKVEM
ncbi:MAG: UvrD-helicase domain-containing protein [Alistipes sp.]|nr:UvrD-helicase domain-containing protein [Alistipes sp.]